MAAKALKTQVCLLNVTAPNHSEEGWMVDGRRIAVPALNPFDPHNEFELGKEISVPPPTLQEIRAGGIMVNRHNIAKPAEFLLNGHKPKADVFRKMQEQGLTRKMAFLYRRMPASKVNPKGCRLFVGGKEEVLVLHSFSDTVDMGGKMFVVAAVAFVAPTDFIGLKIDYLERPSAYELHMGQYTNYFAELHGFMKWKQDFLAPPGCSPAVAARSYKLYDTAGKATTVDD